MNPGQKQSSPNLNGQPKTIWYKTRAGKTFVGVLSIILISILGFIGLSGYYFIQIKRGNQVELAEKFSRNFTLDSTSNAVSQNTVAEDIDTYIKDYSPVLGSSEAPVTVLTFIDFECPFCQRAYPTFRQVMEKYGPAIRVVFKHFPISHIHPNSQRAAVAAMCAEDQGQFWSYYDTLFQQKRFSQKDLISFANNLGMDTDTFAECLDSGRHLDAIAEDLEDVRTLGVRGTPTYFVNKQKIEGSVELEIWDQVILEELSKQ